MTNENAFGIVVSHESGQPVVRVHGELDLLNAPALNDALRALADVGEREVGIDLAAVTFIDSTGVGVLLEGRRSGLALRVTASSRQVDRVLEVAGVDELLRAA